jgi:hypothetical protein
MEAGPELDRIVAEKVMGWKLLPGPTPKSSLWALPGDRIMGVEWSPSTNIEAAWMIIDHFAARPQPNDHLPIELKMIDVDLWECAIWADGGESALVGYTAKAPTAPHAICLAALRAVGHNPE